MKQSELVTQILQRNRRALYLFYRTYTPKLGRLIAAKVSRPEDAEELLQDTLFAFLESLRDFHGQSKLDTYLYAICQHKIIDYYRRKKIKQLLFSQMPTLEKIVSPFFNPEQELDTKLLEEKISQTFNRILPRYKQVLTLKYLDGLSVLAIASKLAVSFKSAEAQLFRARKAFIQLFLSL